MPINEKGLELIKHFEGLYLTAYKDPVGIWTIGYGHTGPDVTKGLVISEAKANQLLESDLLEHESFVDSVVQVDLTDNQRAALTSFAFNVGNGALAGSTLLKKLNKGKYDEAAQEFERWVYGTINGKKVALPGLVKRRKAEKDLFLDQPQQLTSAKMVVSPDAADGGDGSEPPTVLADADGSYEAEFAAHINALGLKFFKPYEFLVLGHQNSNPDSPAYGLNRPPPRELWPNIDATAKVIDRLRELMGAPIATLSVYRTPEYNQAIAGAGQSQHMEFKAIDFVVKSNSAPSDWAAALRQLRQQGFFRGGIGVYSSFVHVDTRGHNADW